MQGNMRQGNMRQGNMRQGNVRQGNMRRQTTCPEPEWTPVDRIVKLSGAEDLAAVLAFLSICPDAPSWPSTAWATFVEPDATSPVERIAFAVVANTPPGNLRAVLMATRVEASVELETLLVRREDRRQGLGKRLSKYWLTWAAHEGATDAVLEVRRSNLAAQRLYQRLGFQVEGCRRGYYRSPTEDALLMRCCW